MCFVWLIELDTAASCCSRVTFDIEHAARAHAAAEEEAPSSRRRSDNDMSQHDDAVDAAVAY